MSDASHQNQIGDIFNKSEGMVRALLDSASQAILSADRSGTIVLANRRAEEMFGYSHEELVGSRIEILLPESKRSTHQRQREKRAPGLIRQIETTVELDMIQIEQLWRHMGLPTV